ncbi:InlB B-repeat-containing protein [Evtepia sp.]|uniref:InlB B-repeat-containing protein n=1 Tax=Evtepia sp. TaxID=2773933 RepID=UPI003F152420
MKKKLMALFLTLALALSLVTPALAVEGGLVDSVTDFIESTITGKEKLLQAKDILISLGEDMKEEIDEATVNLFQKTELVVNDLEIPGVDFQWQIKVPDLDLWVDIYDQTEGGVDLSYAMIANMLDDNDQAKIRCEISLSSFAVQSPEITVDVDDVTEPEPTPVEEQDPVVLEDSKVEIHDDDDSDVTEEPVIPEDPAEPETPSEPETPAEPEPSDEETNVIDQSGLETTATAVTYRAANLSASTRNGIVVANEDTTPATYNVVINYVFENNEIVADPYTANLAAGSNFSATVIFPVVQGYLPYVDEVRKDSIDLTYAAIDQDYTINVVYKPTNVNYTVIHYQQNLNDDKYTEAERETKQGLTNSTVPEVAKNYEGFYALLYEKPAIAADGSTVVEIYYDRYYYLMNFDLDGGYGVEPIYARFGTPIENVGTPTRAGYTFQGWTLDGNAETIPGTVPAENRTYKAVWQPEGTAKVTVVFWGENADDEAYSYIKSAAVNVKPGTEFTYSEGGSLVCGQEVHTHDASCGYACNLEEHQHAVEAGCYELTCDKTSHNHEAEGCELDCNHTHTVDCYTTGDYNYYSLVETQKPTQTLTDTGNGIFTYTTGSGWRQQTHYYLNIGDKWYCAESGLVGSGGDTTRITFNCTHTHTDDCYTCGQAQTTHTHSIEDGCYVLTCDKTEHTHSDACGYNCGKTAHTHTSDCYMGGAGLDSNLWKFVKSDTVTVAADGSSVVNVYYDRTEKTLTFKYDYKNKKYQKTETITAKWGQDISEEYKKIAANAVSTFWSANSSGAEPYTNYFGVMPETNATYYNRGKTGSEGTMTYWGQDLNGDYTVKLFEVTGVGGYNVTNEDRYEFEGFTYNHGTSNGSSCIGAKFYYTRNSYTLTFNDKYKDVKTEYVKYEAPLSAYRDYVPDVPSAYEPGSVTFGGWYLNPEGTGAEYKLDKHTMPADNVLLYAKWVPTTHKVEFYLDKDALDAGTKLSTHPDITVSHGSKAAPTPADPTNGSYTFVGWFYEEDGKEKAFDFANMPVNKDLQVYGKWSSNVLKAYTIYYKYKDSNGDEYEIAAPTTGSGLAGVTKTFEAKGGTDLYAPYQEGYFPMTKSHSLTIDINATEENDTNVYTFWYVQKDAVPYTVKYLNKETGAPVAAEKTVSENRKAVVTETFVPVSGMMPDAYQKRLVVSAEEDAVNEIIFYYTEDTTHAYYKITHYTQNTDGTTWTEYASSQAVGDIGTIYSADPMTIPGFTYDSNAAGTVASGELTANGLELKLYYTRNSYPYQVRYLEKVTGNQLHDPKYATGKYGEVISESAIAITNYTAVDPTSQTLNIRIEKNQNETKLNIITFYYTENEATINYQVVGPAGCGTVSPAAETLKVLSGTAQGSTAAANDGFRFVGWYTDAACQNAVTANDGTVQDNKFTPAKTEGTPWTDATYYAKFEPATTSLTIIKSGCEAVDENQSFIFTVTGYGLPEGGIKVVIVGNGRATIDGLTVGQTYTVTEDASWSWRYSADTGSITLGANIQNEVTITNSRNNPYWLDGNAYVMNKWSTSNITTDVQSAGTIINRNGGSSER